MMDARREVRQIWKHMGRYQDSIGEACVYFVFDADSSHYDTVYDEGYRRYKIGFPLKILWVDQSESPEDYAPEGRRPTQRIRLAVSARDMYEGGVSITEVHGNRIQDIHPAQGWFEDRMHDVLYYDGRYYEVSAFVLKGRVKGEDVVVGVTGIETYVGDELSLDFAPGSVV